MKEILNIISQDVKEIKSDIKEQNKRLTEIEKLDAVQNQQLTEHIRRTEIAEKRLDRLERVKFIIAGITTAIAATAAAVGKFLGVY